MEEKKLEEISTFLNTDLNQDDSLWLTSSHTLRKTIGILVMALPLLFFIFLYFDAGLNQPLESISHYYYTRVSVIFAITVSVLAIFLIIYKGI